MGFPAPIFLRAQRARSCPSSHSIGVQVPCFAPAGVDAIPLKRLPAGGSKEAVTAVQTATRRFDRPESTDAAAAGVPSCEDKGIRKKLMNDRFTLKKAVYNS